MRIRHVLFDLNGTLFDLGTLDEVLAEHGSAQVSAESVLHLAVTEAMVDSLTNRYSDFAELVYRAVSARLGGANRDAADAFVEAMGRMRLADDAADAVALLRDAGVGVGALTNSPTASATALIERVGIHLDPVIGSDAVGCFKPHPAVYNEAISRLGAARAEVALITTHWWDAAGASRAGLRAGFVHPLGGDTPILETEWIATTLRAVAAQIATAATSPEALLDLEPAGT